MPKTQVRKELQFETPDTPGQLAKVCEACGKAGVNIDAVSAYGRDAKGHFRMCTSDNAKAAQVLNAAGYATNEKEVVTMEIENSPGKMLEAARKIGEAGINLKSIYGSASVRGKPQFVVLDSDNNAKLAKLFA